MSGAVRMIVRRLSTIAVPFFLAQVATQFLSLVVGLIIIRMVSVEGYAVYALFGTLVGAAGVTSDLGTGTAIVTFLSRSKGKDERSRIMAGVVQIRIILAILSILAGTTIFLLRYPDVAGELGGSERIVLTVSMVLVIGFQSRAVLARAVLASDQRLSVINRADPFAALLRIIIVGPVFLVAGQTSVIVPVAAWVLSAGTLATWLHINTPRATQWTPLYSVKIPRELWGFLWPLLPGHFYFLFGGLVPVLALGAYAGPEDVAAFWALGRLGMLVASFGPLLQYIAQPYVSRGQDANYARRSWTVVLGAISLVFAIMASGWAFPGYWLLLLGPNYGDRAGFVAVAVTVACLKFLSETLYIMIVASGETNRQYLAVAAGLLAQGTVFMMSPMDSLWNIYLFIGAFTLAELIVHAGLYLRNVRIMRSRVA